MGQGSAIRVAKELQRGDTGPAREKKLLGGDKLLIGRVSLRELGWYH